MTILSRKEILEEIEEKKRIVIHPYHRENAGEGSVDLSLGARFGQLKVIHGIIDPSQVIDASSRLTKPIIDWKTVGRESFMLAPSHSVVGETAEKITLPNDICGWITGRGRLVTLGLNLQISTGFVKPGTSEEQLFFLITNLATASVALTPGIRICQLVLQRVR